MSAKRVSLDPAHLYAILDLEFRQLRSDRCTRCHVPLPYWRKAPDDVSANWIIGTPKECEHGCHLVIAELLTRMWTRYDMLPGREH
jgi:hypothetical protein